MVAVMSCINMCVEEGCQGRRELGVVDWLTVHDGCRRRKRKRQQECGRWGSKND